jgi:hypothetical protein
LHAYAQSQPGETLPTGAGFPWWALFDDRVGYTDPPLPDFDPARALIWGYVEKNPKLKASRDLLANTPGVGAQTASTVLAELPPRREAAERPGGGRVRRAGPARVPLGGERAQADAAVQGGQRAAAQGAVPADADRGPLQPCPQEVLQEAGGRGQAED